MSLSNDLSPTVLSCLQTIFEAIAAADYDRFTTVGNSAYKAGITRQMFEGVSEQLAPRMQEGYSTTYFGTLKQRHYRVYVWKLNFADGGDEFLVRMTMEEDKVAGILIT